MAAHRPVVYLAGFLAEMPGGDGAVVIPRALASPALADLEEGELVADSASPGMVLRLGSLLYRFAPIGASAIPSGADFSDPDNSIWLGVYA
jgi:hypothetical protein